MPFGQTVHDWTANFGDWTFGIQELYWPPSPLLDTNRMTVIYVGPTDFTVSLSAYAVLSFFIIGSQVAVFVLAMLCTRYSGARDGTP